MVDILISQSMSNSLRQQMMSVVYYGLDRLVYERPLVDNQDMLEIVQRSFQQHHLAYFRVIHETSLGDGTLIHTLLVPTRNVMLHDAATHEFRFIDSDRFFPYDGHAHVERIEPFTTTA